MLFNVCMLIKLLCLKICVSTPTFYFLTSLQSLSSTHLFQGHPLSPSLTLDSAPVVTSQIPLLAVAVICTKTKSIWEKKIGRKTNSVKSHVFIYNLYSDSYISTLQRNIEQYLLLKISLDVYTRVYTNNSTVTETQQKVSRKGKRVRKWGKNTKCFVPYLSIVVYF